MKIDVITLILLLATTSIIQIFIIYFQVRLNKNFPGIKLWAIGNALTSLGIILMLFRGLIYLGPLAVVFSNVLVVLGEIVIYGGIVRFLYVKEKRRLVIAVFVILVIFLCYFTYINDNSVWRVFLVSAAIGIISIRTAVELLSCKKASIKQSTIFLAILFLTYGLYFIFRGIISLAFSISNDFFEATVLQISSFAVSIVVEYLWTVGLIFMINQRLSSGEEEAENMFQLVFETGPEAMFITRLQDGLIAEVNENFTLYTGFAKEEAIGKTTISLGIWHNKMDRERLVHDLTERGDNENLEAMIRKKDGTIFTSLISAKIMDINGTPHLISVFRDISHRKLTENALRKSEEKFKAIANYTANLETWIGVDGEVIWVNPAVERYTGYSEEETINTKSFILTITYPDDLKKVEDELELALKGIEDSGEDIEFRCIRKDGTVFWISVNWHSVEDIYGDFAGIRMSGKDISKGKIAEEDVKVLSQAVEQSPAVIVITDINGRIQYVNKKFIEITGYSSQEVIDKNPRILNSGLLPSEFYENLWSTILSGNEWRGEFHNKKKNGEFYWESASISPIFDEAGNIEKLLAVKEDITQRKYLEEELQIQARIDVLTGINNRRFFMESVERELFRGIRYRYEYAFVMLDIDHFKKVNDNFGHHFGDAALKEVTKACSSILRETDIFGRIGGEEFAILLVETNFASALEIAERLRKSVEEVSLYYDNGVKVPLAISLGLTKYHGSEDTINGLLIRSDKALYEAKESGRNKVVSIV